MWTGGSGLVCETSPWLVAHLCAQLECVVSYIPAVHLLSLVRAEARNSHQSQSLIRTPNHRQHDRIHLTPSFRTKNMERTVRRKIRLF